MPTHIALDLPLKETLAIPLIFTKHQRLKKLNVSFFNNIINTHLWQKIQLDYIFAICNMILNALYVMGVGFLYMHMLMVLLNFYFNDITTLLFHSTCKHINDKHIITRSMTKISRAQVTQDVTMGNPSKGKTHQEKSFLYNEEYKYKRYRSYPLL